MRSRRWLLWGALLLLVALMLGVMVFLAREYEEARDQAAVESDAAAVASDIRSALIRNVQTLQSLHSVVPTPVARHHDHSVDRLSQHALPGRAVWHHEPGSGPARHAAGL